jgi:Protein of unknown function (DUF1524)
MTRTLRATAISLAAILAATLGPTPPAPAAGYSASLTTAVAGLPVATEVRTGYSRDLFPHWIDADGDGCSTRNEVLYAEATTKPTISGTCTLSGGRWYSYYDNAYWTLTGDLDIDHMVPLAEAWRSGAWAWTTAQRQAYANDLGGPELWAVTDNVNQAKGDQDVTTWKPPLTSFWCTYARAWIQVKWYYHLTLQSAEKTQLTSMLGTC